MNSGCGSIFNSMGLDPHTIIFSRYRLRELGNMVPLLAATSSSFDFIQIQIFDGNDVMICKSYDVNIQVVHVTSNAM